MDSLLVVITGERRFRSTPGGIVVEHQCQRVEGSFGAERLTSLHWFASRYAVQQGDYCLAIEGELMSMSVPNCDSYQP